jgi:hypothetical protein
VSRWQLWLLALTGSCITGELLGRWLFARAMRTVDDNLAEMGD